MRMRSKTSTILITNPYSGQSGSPKPRPIHMQTKLTSWFLKEPPITRFNIICICAPINNGYILFAARSSPWGRKGQDRCGPFVHSSYSWPGIWDDEEMTSGLGGRNEIRMWALHWVQNSYFTLYSYFAVIMLLTLTF